MHNLTQNAANALKQKPDGTIIWKASQKGTCKYLSILDNAGGMAKDLVDQFNNNSSVIQSGKGIGMLIVKDLASRIGCELSLQTWEGQGSEFVIKFQQEGEGSTDYPAT